MKKKLLAVLAVFILGALVLVIGICGDDPLDPAVREALSLHYPDIPPEQNAHVGVSGLGNSQYPDVVTAGQKYLKDGYQGQKDPQREVDFDFAYKNPCVFTQLNEGCLDQIAADASIIDQAAQKNQEILARYRIVQKMPLFVNSSGFSDPVPRYSLVLGASRLLGAKALLDIKRGDVEAGLEFFEADLDFYMMMGQSEHISLIDLMIAVGGLKNSLIALSKIIEDDQIDLSGQEARLRKMLDLDFNPNQMMAAALAMEKRQFLPGLLQLNEEGFPAAQDLKHKLMVRFLFKRNMTINRIAARADEVIEKIKSAPLLGYPEANRRLEAWQDKMTRDTEPDFRSLYNYYGLFFFKNYLGETVFNIAQPMYMRYAARANDTLVFARLVRAQLELRLRPDHPADISQALADLGPETLNPYTGKPFEWDKEENRLRAESAVKLEAALDSGPPQKYLEAAVPPSRP